MNYKFICESIPGNDCDDDDDDDDVVVGFESLKIAFVLIPLKNLITPKRI